MQLIIFLSFCMDLIYIVLFIRESKKGTALSMHNGYSSAESLYAGRCMSFRSTLSLDHRPSHYSTRSGYLNTSYTNHELRTRPI